MDFALTYYGHGLGAPVEFFVAQGTGANLDFNLVGTPNGPPPVISSLGAVVLSTIGVGLTTWFNRHKKL